LRKNERQVVASLLKLCCKEVETTPLSPSYDTSSAPNIDASFRSSSTKTNATNAMCWKFNIHTPDIAVLLLVTELVGEMKVLEKAPVRQQLLRGLKVTMHLLNNKMKKYIYIPQCIDGTYVDTSIVE
jgi:hypothetical protein